VAEVKKTSAKIQWTDGASNGRPILFYAIFARTAGNSSWVRLVRGMIENTANGAGAGVRAALNWCDRQMCGPSRLTDITVASSSNWRACCRLTAPTSLLSPRRIRSDMAPNQRPVRSTTRLRTGPTERPTGSLAEEARLVILLSPGR